MDSGEPRNRFTTHMHGVLGHDGHDPAELLADGRTEVSRYGIEFLAGSVATVTDRSERLTVTMSDGRPLGCRALIAASGLDDELPEVPGLAERWGPSVLHCPYCHGWEVRNRRLGVLATSPLSLHQVELVRQWSNHVVFFSAAAGTLDPPTERRLEARGIELVSSPVLEVIGPDDAVRAVRTADAETVAVDALFTMGTPRPRDHYLAALGLERVDTAFGSFLSVDATGRTSHPRIWAAGNVTDPTANVVVAMSTGATVGAMANLALVTEDFDDAAEHAVKGAA